MAHKKAGGSTVLGRDSHGQRLGIKLTHGAFARPGAIIVRQRGTKFRAGDGVMRGSDDSLFAVVPGVVAFERRTRRTFTGARRFVHIVSVAPKARA